MIKAKKVTANTENLILACLRADPDREVIPAIRRLAEKEVDWKLFRENAVASGSYLIIYNRLRAANHDSVIPEDMLDSLKAAYLYAVSKTCFRHKETKHLLDLFHRKNIPVVALKGEALAERLYGDIAARGISGDTDLLVEEDKKQAAAGILEEAGYGFYNQFSVDAERLWQHSYKKDGEALVDLHWTISPFIAGGRGMVKRFWEDAKSREAGGIRYYELSEEDLLLYLSVHYAGDMHTAGLRQICDISRLLEKYKDTISWERLMEKADAYGVRGSLYTALAASKNLLGAQMPVQTIRKIKIDLVKRLFITAFTDRHVILKKNSARRKFLEFFLKYLFFQIIEARTLKDYREILFPARIRMGNRSYAGRIRAGLLKFTKALHPNAQH